MPSQSFHFIIAGTPPVSAKIKSRRRGREGCRQIMQLGHSHKHTLPPLGRGMGSIFGAKRDFFFTWEISHLIQCLNCHFVNFWVKIGSTLKNNSVYMPWITDSMTNSPVFCYYGTQGLLMLTQLDLKRTCAIADVLFLSMWFSLRAHNGP